MVQTIWTHHDADGIASAYLTQFAYPKAQIKVVESFGDTSGWVKGDIMTDMRPDDPTIEGLVIDHHIGHPPLGIRKYDLIFEDKPATIIAWEQFHNVIPKEEWWKAAIGAAGDVQCEKLPYEVWNSNKSLMKRYSTFVNNKYKGQWNCGFYPIFGSLGSGINSFCRYGNYDMAFDTIRRVKTPMALIKDWEVIKQKMQLKKDFVKIMNGSNVYELPNFKIIVYKSPEVRMSGYAASVMWGDEDDITVIAINDENGSLSVRGTLANYFKGIIKEHKLDYITVDGHAGFMGGKITKDPLKLYYDLMEIL